MIGILIVCHGSLANSLAAAVTHVLGHRPEQFDTLSVGAKDDPSQMLPKARQLVKDLDTGEGVLVFSDIYGATPCNLASKLLVAGRVEAVAGVNLPMLVRAITYRDRDLDTMIKKAISGGCDGVLRVDVNPLYASTRS
jgi:PTS system ascorbate-specific IIA component